MAVLSCLHRKDPVTEQVQMDIFPVWVEKQEGH